MSIEGRISVDALFHDKDGTSVMRVVSLSRTESANPTNVVHLSGTCDTTGITISFPYTYAGASGQQEIQFPAQLVLQGNDVFAEDIIDEQPDGYGLRVYTLNNEITKVRFPYVAAGLKIRAANFTGTYSMVVVAYS